MTYKQTDNFFNAQGKRVNPQKYNSWTQIKEEIWSFYI